MSRARTLLHNSSRSFGITNGAYIGERGGTARSTMLRAAVSVGTIGGNLWARFLQRKVSLDINEPQ